MQELQRNGLGLAASLLLVSCLANTSLYAQITLTESRSALESKLTITRASYASAPGDRDVRREHAITLFKLGNVWQANDVIAPLAEIGSARYTDLELGARLALLTMDLVRAEKLYTHLAAVTDLDSNQHERAVNGLVMVYYQSGQFDKALRLTLPGNDKQAGSRLTLLKFLQRFQGVPYQTTWQDNNQIAHLPFTNDVHKPGAVPEINIAVNGHVVLLTLDTGGDRLYLDESVAERAGIRELVMHQAKYAYTKGKLVNEPWGVADKVVLGGVTLKQVPTVVAQWKANGPTTDGVIGTALLKQFLSTIDYDKAEVTLRPRGGSGMTQFLRVMEDRELVRMPFFLTATHLMFAKGQINGHRGLNLFLDSGLAASMPMVLINETTNVLKLKKHAIEGTPYYWSALASHGLSGLEMGATQALGNVFVEKDNYRSQGFVWDALLSHQYLRKLGSWTIDFDTMSYFFPAPKE